MSLFRRPPPQRPPDAAQWEAAHGPEARPFDLPDDRLAQCHALAAELSAEDWTLLEARPVHGIQAGLDCVCESAAAQCDLPVTTSVWYDPVRRKFIAYPRPDREAQLRKATLP